MANKRYSVDKELDITLSLKVKITMLSNYFHLSEEQIETILNNLEEDFERGFMFKLQQIKMLENASCDYVYFEIKD